MKLLNPFLIFSLAGLILMISGCQRAATKADDTYYREEETVKPAPKPQEPVREETVSPADEQSAKPVRFEDIHFDFDQYDLTYNARGQLAEYAQVLEENPDIRLTIEGHCDEWGTIEYNLALGEKRANAVRDYLVNIGTDPSRLQTISYGKERPLDTAHNEEAWARNRRASLVIQQQGGRP